jgi:predicted DNA-binding transcriptional regulator YafY
VRADRLLSTLLLLQAHRRMTGRELARRLEVSIRTVHRDMDALSAAGVPVLALRGARGGWQLDETWRTQVPGLDESELRALLLAQPRVTGDSRLAAAAERALGKLMASLPAPMRERAGVLRERLHIDATGWRGVSENLAMLPIVQDAVERDRKLALQYTRAAHGSSEQTHVVVDPLGLVSKGSAWYLVARAPSGFRTYRVSRIDSAVVLDQASERPRDFDLAAHWTSSTAQLQQGWQQYNAILRVEPSAARWVRAFQSATVVEDADPADRPGWVTLHVRFDREAEACFVVMALGPRVDVIEPEALRNRVAAEAAAVLARIAERKSRGD